MSSLTVVLTAPEFLLKGAKVAGGMYLPEKIFVARISDISC